MFKSPKRHHFASPVPSTRPASRAVILDSARYISLAGFPKSCWGKPLKNKLRDILNIEIPIISAPMGGATGPTMAAAVSEAGGFGTIPLWGGSTEQVRKGIQQVRALTDRNFAVNLNMDFPHEEKLQACIEEELFAVSLFWGVKPGIIESAKKGGLVVLSTVGNAREAKLAADAGADIIVAQGWEAGGHVWGQVATMALVPAVVDTVSVPVVAAGGIADGRGMAAALMLGASGVWVGTRFLASNEANIHPDYRQLIQEASEDHTGWYQELYDGFWPDAPHRSLENSTSERWRAAESPRSGSRPDEDAVVGYKPDGEAVMRYQSYTPQTGTTGDIAAMSLWCGQGVAQVQETMAAAEIVEEIYRDARRILQAGSDVLDEA